jgi:beta-glucanase (GH16 family)
MAAGAGRRAITALAFLTLTSLIGASCALPCGEASASAGVVVQDFDGPAGSPPDPGVWSAVSGSGWDIGIETYDPAQALLDGQGHLAIRAVEQDGHYRSGRVQTKGKLDLGYGTFTARMKVPAGQGLWPAFWLVQADQADVTSRRLAEIDIVELVSDTTTSYSTAHGPKDGGGMYQVQLTGPTADLSTDFHDYWATHAPDRITFGIDDRTLGTVTPASLPPGGRWVFNRPMYAILTLAVGGSWAGPPDSATAFPATLLVDSFRWDPM